jgi:DNA-binding YbaB/EbfC family protein
MNPKQMMKQVQAMQAQMQQRMSELLVEGSAGGGMVKAKMNGHKELLGIAIDKEAVDPNDVEMLQDLVVAAVNEALELSKQLAAAKMQGVASGLGLPPGLV